jgi:hypothetical protein
MGLMDQIDGEAIVEDEREDSRLRERRNGEKG